VWLKFGCVDTREVYRFWLTFYLEDHAVAVKFLDQSCRGVLHGQAATTAVLVMSGKSAVIPTKRDIDWCLSD